jgi:hypothetical protein
MGAVAVEAFVIWRTHQVTFSAVGNVAFVWLVTGMWLSSRLGKVMHSSTAEIYRGFRDVPMEGLARTIFNGGLLMAVASFGLLFR